ncbi:hypothetical protein HK105_203167 [Polyrhizophydium stewartii]|uniref:Uncharacterized protein n=1 Tax=Polyrhizophydium stewartii TaxID=2732419 RepID=A0ABR4NC83_9FUNG
MLAGGPLSAASSNLRICVVGADTLVGAALVDELVHGRFRSSFRAVTALVADPDPRRTPRPRPRPLSSRETPPAPPAAPGPDPADLPDSLDLLDRLDRFSFPGKNPNVATVAISAAIGAVSPDDVPASPHAPAPAPAPAPPSASAFDSVCIVPPDSPDRVRVCERIIRLCEAAGVNNVVLVSLAHPDWVSNTVLPRHFEFRRIEFALKASSIAGHCIVRHAFPQQLLAHWIDTAAAKGVLAMPINNGVFAPIHVADIAATVASIFAGKTSYGPHMCPMYRSSMHVLTGPAALSGTDLADMLGQALGRDVTFTSNSHNEARRHLERRAAALSKSDSLPSPSPAPHPLRHHHSDQNHFHPYRPAGNRSPSPAAPQRARRSPSPPKSVAQTADLPATPASPPELHFEEPSAKRTRQQAISSAGGLAIATRPIPPAPSQTHSSARSHGSGTRLGPIDSELILEMFEAIRRDCNDPYSIVVPFTPLTPTSSGFQLTGGRVSPSAQSAPPASASLVSPSAIVSPAVRKFTGSEPRSVLCFFKQHLGVNSASADLSSPMRA